MVTERTLSDGHNEAGKSRSKRQLFRIIFLSDTTSGRGFDIALQLMIALSVAVIMLESVAEIRFGHRDIFRSLEWFFTILFTIEYLFRLWCVRSAWTYARSFYGVVDLLAIVPGYLSLLVTGTGYLLIVRVLRMLRLFRILKLSRYVSAADTLLILTLVTVFGSMMYLIEGPENGFTSIPRGIYWAIVTLTTVGYGDITPHTTVGQMVSAMVMVLGYGIIAVPTGIYAAELRDVIVRRRETIKCAECSRVGHDDDAKFCKFCGSNLTHQELFTGD
jgi:voltage-gated potassium channel